MSTHGLTRLALLAYYCRISKTRRFRWCIYSIAVLVVLYTGVCALLIIFDRHSTVRDTIDGLIIAISFNVCNIITDIMLICTPLPVIFSLQLPLRQRLSVYFILLLGSG